MNRQIKLKYRFLSLLILAVAGLFVSVASAVEYTSVEGGSEGDMLLWEDTSTWADGTVPDDSVDGYFKIVDNSYVTMYSSNVDNIYNRSTADCFIWGTLDISSRLKLAILSINSINATGSEGKTGTLNLNDLPEGSATVYGNLGGSGTLNVNIAGCELGLGGEIGDGTTVTLDMSGVLSTQSLGGTINLNGGTLKLTSDDSTTITDLHINQWQTGGVFMVNTSMSTSDIELADKFSASEGTQLSISSFGAETAKLTLTDTGENWNFDSTDSKITFDARDDLSPSFSDQIIVESGATISVGSDTTILLNGAFSEIEDPQVFVGNTYQLFNVADGDYSGITPNMPTTMEWTINEQSYTVTFENNLATNGTVTIVSIVPEPVTAGLLIFGGTAMLKRRNR